MQFTQTKIPEVILIEPKVYEDNRGWFMESFNEKLFRQELERLGQKLPNAFVQDNHSCSNKSVLRGLHYQLDPFAQGKLVRVGIGSILDVAVDLRKDSPTFGLHVAEKLSAQNKRMLRIPPGFAHGFLTLEDNTHVLYKTTAFYSQQHERSMLWSDPDLAINWPLSFTPIVHSKDASASSFRQFVYES